MLLESENDKLFVAIGEDVETVENVLPDAEDEGGRVVQEIESLCMQCEENGTTRLLLTRIPYFREVILMSFSCPHCGLQNTEVQSAGEIQELGVIYTFKCATSEDLDRKLVKSATCTVKIPEIDLEIPAQRGVLTTIQGVLETTLEELSQTQSVRQHVDPDTHAKVEEFIQRGRELAEGNKLPFTIELNDPAGNSWIEVEPGISSNNYSLTRYLRTPTQNAQLGLSNPDAVEEENFHPDEVHTFSGACPSCTRPCDTNMKLVDIPHFKEVVLMSTVCEFCGFKSNEVKTGGQLSPKGKKITVRIQDVDDLKRDILKSETASLNIPELGFDLQPGTLGGRFTTIEGLLQQSFDQLYGRVYNPMSDSTSPAERSRFDAFLQQMKDAIEGKTVFTLILDDPLAASYIQNYYAPEEDPEMSIDEYVRSEEQDEELGLLDMRVEADDYTNNDTRTQ